MEVTQTQKNFSVCGGCGEFNDIQTENVASHKQLVDSSKTQCSKCDSPLYAYSKSWLTVSSALAVTSLVLYFLAVFCPFLTLSIGIQTQSITIFEGFLALLERDNWILAGLILATLVLIPLFEIFALVYLLVPYSLNKRFRAQASVLRWLTLAKSWSMLEVFLVSMVICSIKMADLADLTFELGAYVLFILVSVLSLAFSKLDRRKLWSAVNPNNYFSADEHENVHECRVCFAMVGESITQSVGTCPRCNAKVARRIPHSLQKTSAFLLAAVILYIPANFLPIMTYTSLGVKESDTIFSGVVSLISSGLYWIAAVVFVASIAVPIAKIAVLAHLIWSVKTGSTRGIKGKTKLYKVTEIVGRWSMIDVFVVTIFVALIQFGFIYAVEPEAAIIAFAAVVVLTMLAAESFDIRLLWDSTDREKIEKA